MPSFAIRVISAREVRPLRQKLLRPHQRAEELIYPEDDNPQTFHLGAYVGNKLIAISSFLFDSHTDFTAQHQYRIRGMATLPEFQKQGIGEALVESGLEKMKNTGAKLVWCNARASAFGFYEKVGFQYSGELFNLEGIGPHKVMWLSLEV